MIESLLLVVHSSRMELSLQKIAMSLFRASGFKKQVCSQVAQILVVPCTPIILRFLLQEAQSVAKKLQEPVNDIL